MLIGILEGGHGATWGLPAARRPQNLHTMGLLLYSNWFLPAVLFRSGGVGGASADD
jgi:hypothetical protein